MSGTYANPARCRPDDAENLRFSLVIPVKDEAESLPALVDDIAATLSGEPFEVVVVDDGSTDATPAVLRQLAHRHPFIRTRVHERCCGKSAALVTGVRAARAELIATLDGDGQDNIVTCHPCCG